MLIALAQCQQPAFSARLPPRDLWRLGKHRRRCGDATSADHVAHLLDGVTPHLMVTAPPCGVAYDPAWRNETGAAKTKHTGEALAATKTRDVKLGNPNGAAAHRRAGKGGEALRAAICANADDHAAALAPAIAELRRQGPTSLRVIAAELIARGVLTRRGGPWHVSTFRNPLARQHYPPSLVKFAMLFSRLAPPVRTINCQCAKNVPDRQGRSGTKSGESVNRLPIPEKAMDKRHSQ